MAPPTCTGQLAEAAVAASISRLTSLKELVLTVAPEQYISRPSTGMLCTGLQPLTKLTRLDASSRLLLHASCQPL